METEISSNAVENEIAKLQGTWKQTACEIDGIKNLPDEFGSEPRVTYAGNEYIVTTAGDQIVIKGKFRVDPGQTPKAIDWMDTFGADAGKTFPAIYTLDEDRLVFCAADQDQPRPTEFRAGPAQVLRIHERVPKNAGNV